jgi:predicted deacylase
MKLPSLLHMSAPLREDFDIPFHEIGDPHQPIRLALVAGVHGNELNGVLVLSRLADYLHDVQSGKIPEVQLQQRVLIIPAVNVLGLNMRMRLWPFDKSDINRMFPGYDQGETTQRIAAAVLAATQSAYYRIDVHNSNLDFEEFPHLRLYNPTELERQHAEFFNLSTILENQIDKILSVSLIQAWKSYGGENYILRAGQAGSLQLNHCESLFEALQQFLFRTGILSGRQVSTHEKDMFYFKPEQCFRIISEEAGFFVSRQDPGRWMKTGDLVGYLYDGFTGKVREEIKSPVAGLLLGIRRQPLVFEGDLIARVQVVKS